MKYFLTIMALIISHFLYSQSTGYLRYDSVRMEKIGGNSEFILLNRTRDTLGPLYNLGNGRTGFKSLSGLGIATKNINGIAKSLDTLKLGDSLTQYTYIQSLVHGTNNTRFRALVIGNLPEAQSLNGIVGYNPLFNTYNPATLGLQRIYSTAAGDINLGQYGGLESTIFRISRDSTDATFVAGGTNEALPGLGGEFVSQWFPQRDSSVLSIGRDGQSGNELFAQKDIGQSWGYNVFVKPEASLPGFPLSSIRSSIDFSRVLDNDRRKKMTGAGVAGFISMYKSYQNTITGSTYSAGNVTDSVFGFAAYGDAYPLINTNTKAKALAIWSVNNAYAFFAHPQYRYTNTVKDGYAFVAKGDSDYNHLPWLNIGPYSTLPTRANSGNGAWTRRLYVNGDVEATGTNYALVHQAAGVVVSMPVALASEAVVNFQQKDTSSVTATLGAYLSPADRNGRGGYWRSEIFTAAVMDNNQFGGFLQFETGANHVNTTRINRNGNWEFGRNSSTILYRAYKKVIISGGTLLSATAGDTVTIKNIPTGAAAGDSTNYKPLVVNSNGDVFKAAWVGGSAGSGTNNANVGSGFRWLKPSTQEIKTAFAGIGILIDSSSNTDGLTFKSDTLVNTTISNTMKKIDSMVLINASRYWTISTLNQGVSGNVAGSRFGTAATVPIRIFTNGSQRILIDSSKAQLQLGSPTVDNVNALIIQGLSNSTNEGIKVYSNNLSASATLAWNGYTTSGDNTITSNTGNIVTSVLSTKGVGIGITPTSTFTVGGSFGTTIRQLTALRTLDKTDQIIEVTANTFTVTLPTAASISGRTYTITNSGSGVTTVATTGGETFVNVTATPTTLTLNQFNTVTVVSNGTNWLRTTNL